MQVPMNGPIFKVMVMDVHSLGRDPQPRTRGCHRGPSLNGTVTLPSESQAYWVLLGD